MHKYLIGDVLKCLSTSLFVVTSSLVLCCVTKSPALAKEIVTETAPTALVGDKATIPADTTTAESETVESLSRDLDLLQRELVQLAEPLNPQQEQKVLVLKNKIDSKELKKASLELKNMLDEIQEVEE